MIKKKNNIGERDGGKEGDKQKREREGKGREEEREGGRLYVSPVFLMFFMAWKKTCCRKTWL